LHWQQVAASRSAGAWLQRRKQWLRVYMQSKMIKHNKDLFESLDDPLALLEKLHIY
jgi:hypothetical protein